MLDQISDLKFVTNFELEQCFCSCSIAIDGPHMEDCPNYGKPPYPPPFERYLLFTLKDGRRFKVHIKTIEVLEPVASCVQ